MNIDTIHALRAAADPGTPNLLRADGTTLSVMERLRVAEILRDAWEAEQTILDAEIEEDHETRSVCVWSDRRQSTAQSSR